MKQLPPQLPSRAFPEDHVSPGSKNHEPIRLILLPLLLLFLLAGTGCSTVNYYSQAVHGHLQIQSKRVRIEKLLSDPSTDETLKERLRKVLELREFAQQELGLPTGKNYLRYADLQRPHVVWTVHATPEFSLKSKRWWYPFVGRLKYRGFFDARHAQQLAQKLRAQKNDVFVGGVDAYSTLGWFSDPVLNTFIDRDETNLAELLFHELAHRRYFRHGDTDFNEAFATFVAEVGVRKWIESRPESARPKLLSHFEQSLERERILVRIVQDYRTRLGQLYDTAQPAQLQEASAYDRMQQEKQRILSELDAELSLRLKDSTTGKPLIAGSWNNARLNTVATYHDLVPQFRERYAAEGSNLTVFLKNIRGFHPHRNAGHP